MFLRRNIFCLIKYDYKYSPVRECKQLFSSHPYHHHATRVRICYFGENLLTSFEVVASDVALDLLWWGATLWWPTTSTAAYYDFIFRAQAHLRNLVESCVCNRDRNCYQNKTKINYILRMESKKLRDVCMPFKCQCSVIWALVLKYE